MAINFIVYYITEMLAFLGNKFNLSAFCWYQGFYAVYGEVFRKISLEDEEYMDVIVKAPGFGNSASSYEEVIITVLFVILVINKSGTYCRKICRLDCILFIA